MILYVNGCSCTWGQELPLDIRESVIWPTIFAQEIGIDHVHMAAEPGSSNDKIFRETMSYVSSYIANGNDPKELMIIIGWTVAGRREFYNTNRDRWQTFLPNWGHFNSREDKLLWSVYYPDFCDAEKDFERMLIQILSLQSFLKQNNVSYYFVHCLGYDGFEYAMKEHKRAKLHHDYQDMLKMIDPQNCFGLLEFINFSDWSKEKGYPLAPGLHPLEEAHIAWGKLVASKWIESR